MATLDIEGLRQVIAIAMDKEVSQLDIDVDLYNELGMDSIGAVAMIVEIQRRYKIRIKEEDIPHLRTPALLLQYVNKALQEQLSVTSI